ncbi:hypothetical protein [Labilibaculum euxinus]
MEYVKDRDEILRSDQRGIGIAALYVPPPRNSVHVGVFCNWDDFQNVVHFKNTNDIEIANLNLAKFDIYKYSWLSDFPELLIDSLLATVELINENEDNTLVLDLKSIVYNGGVFEIATGKYIIQTTPECQMNCGVFVMALLETYDYQLINWESWPAVTIQNRNDYLEGWLTDLNIPSDTREEFYHFNREIRGRHIMASSQFGNISSEYNVVEASSQQLMDYFTQQYN